MKSRYSTKLCAAAAAGALAATVAGSASAAVDIFLKIDGPCEASGCDGDDPPPPPPPPPKPSELFAGGIHGFALATQGGAFDPGILVAFNPEIDPATPQILLPPQTSAVYLNGLAAEFSNSWAGAYTLQFALTGLGTGLIPTPAAPDANGVTTFETTYEGHVFDVYMGFEPGPDPASWASFNSPIGLPGQSMALSLQFPQDADMAFMITEDGRALTLSSPAPEPATWAILTAGLTLLGAALRRRARSDGEAPGCW
jgi:hypothetical protein